MTGRFAGADGIGASGAGVSAVGASLDGRLSGDSSVGVAAASLVMESLAAAISASGGVSAPISDARLSQCSRFGRWVDMRVQYSNEGGPEFATGPRRQVRVEAEGPPSRAVNRSL